MFWRSSKEKEEEEDYEEEVDARQATRSEIAPVYVAPDNPYQDTSNLHSSFPNDNYPSSGGASYASSPPLLQLAQKINEPTQSKFLKDDVTLILGKHVYLSGPFRNKDTSKTNQDIQLHVVDVHGNIFPMNIERWKMYGFKERIMIRTHFLGRESGVVILEDSSDASKCITVFWNEFADNFTPFKPDDSSKIDGQKGSFFTTKDWTMDGANIVPAHLQKQISRRRSSSGGSSDRSHHGTRDSHNNREWHG